MFACITISQERGPKPSFPVQSQLKLHILASIEVLTTWPRKVVVRLYVSDAHYFRAVVVVVDDDLAAPGSTSNNAERAGAHGDLLLFASLVEQGGSGVPPMVSCEYTGGMCLPFTITYTHLDSATQLSAAVPNLSNFHSA